MGQSDRSDPFEIRPDVRYDRYIGKCPGCGRVRLELYVDGSEDDPRAVGVECEKCKRQWVLDPNKADFYGEHDDRDPLHPPPPENPIFGGA